MKYIDKPYGNTLADLGDKNPNMVVVDADLQRATETEIFQERFPERYFDIGIAEANMVGISAGLALSGKVVFCGTFASFITQRVCDQVFVSVAYSNANVKLAGVEPGLASGRNGASHQALLDLAIMRAIPNMMVFDPADAIEMRAIMEYLAFHPYPAYMRVQRGKTPVILEDNEYIFVPGKSVKLREGSDATIIASGIEVLPAIEAADILSTQGISCRVIDMASIKPIDQQAIIESANDTGCIVTAENHSVLGGLGAAVAEVVTSHFPVPVVRVGIKDKFGEVGPIEWLAKKFELDAGAIFAAVQEAIEMKERIRKNDWSITT